MEPRSTHRLRVFTLAFLLGGPAIALAQSPELQKLLPSSLAAYDHAGVSVALDGAVAVIGAPDHDVVGVDEGAVFVYRHDGTQFQEEQTLVGSDSANYDDFGVSVAVSGNFLAVGASLHDALGADAGAVYVYQYAAGVWTQKQKLTASDGNAGDYFGASVALLGDVLVVGAPGDDLTSADVGSAYVFRYKGSFVGWTESQKLTAPSPASYDQFGYSLDLDPSRLVVGCPLRDSLAYDAGAVYLYTIGTTLTFEAEVVSASAQYSDNFGTDVALDGSLLAVGLPHDDDAGSESGSVCVFEYTGGAWVEEVKLLPPVVYTYEYFGLRLDLDDGNLAIGAEYADTDGTDSGVVYSYVRHGGDWYYDQPLGSSAGATSDHFGSAVSVDGDLCLSGARYDDDKTWDAGAAFVHVVGRFVLDAEPNAVNSGDTLTFTSYAGTPGTPCWFAVVNVGGTPYFQILFSLRFAADHHMTFSTSTPPGLSGVSIGFETFKIGPWGKAMGSNLEFVDFL